MEKNTKENILKFEKWLICEEKSKNTVKKYVRDVEFFVRWLGKGKMTKSTALEYKKILLKKYPPKSANSIISSLNSFFCFMGKKNICLKTLKIHQQIFSDTKKELTKYEYEKLLNVAKKRKNKKIFYVMQTLCSTGIRISELEFITVLSLKSRCAHIDCKGKMRTVFLPKKLCKILKKYVSENNIKSGSVFVTKNGKPLDRSYVWKILKSLCDEAGVSKEKVFPHNFRHLFARTYYSKQKDIVRLADILGHSSVNTTRIYTMEDGTVHKKQIEKLGLLYNRFDL